MAIRKILVLGASGGTGQQLVTQALAAGHEVTAFVRDPNRLRISHDRLRVLVGDTTSDFETLSEAVRGRDIVISSLGAGKSLKSGGLITRSVPLIVRAMESQSVRRLIFISAYGVGVTVRDVPLVPRILIRVLLSDLYADKKAGEDELLRSGVDWTILYPTTLIDGPQTGHYRVDERLALRGLPRVSRADVADFIVNHLEESRDVKRQLLISY
jgi:putative NADH-flavin reductase